MGQSWTSPDMFRPRQREWEGGVVEVGYWEIWESVGSNPLIDHPTRGKHLISASEQHKFVPKLIVLNFTA